jgi:REP element-mobilizing transposase RayT
MENSKRVFGEKYYWKEHTLKNAGYFASSISNVSKEAAENCILNQS